MTRAQRDAYLADRARTKYSNRSLATGRRTTTRRDDALRSEQAMYRARFGVDPPSAKQMPVISDTDDTYPDAHWDRTTSTTQP